MLAKTVSRLPKPLVIYVAVVFCLLWYRRTRECTQSSMHKTASKDFMMPAISPS